MTVNRIPLSLVVFATACSHTPERDEDVDVAMDVGEPGALYVNETAQPDGDGSALAPFQSLDDAANSAGETPWFILAPGAYTLSAEHSFTSVRLDGAGSDTTRVTGLANFSVSGEIAVDAVSLETVGSLAPGALVFTSVDIEGDVTIEAPEVTLDAVEVTGATVVVTTDRLSVVNVDAAESTLTLSALTASVRELDVEETDGPALTIVGPGTWDIEDLGLADVGQDLTQPDGDAGVCVVVDGATVDVEGLDAVRCAWRGVAIRNAAEVTLTDSVVAGAGNTAVSVQSGAILSIVDMDVSDASVLLFTNEATLVAQGVLGERSRNSAVLTGGGASVTITESTFLDSPNGHISILGPDTSASIVGNLLDGTEFESCFAVSSTDAPVELSGNTIRNCAGAGVTLGSGSGFVVADNEISNIFAVEPFPDLAEGVSAVRAEVEIRGNNIHDVGGAGVALLNSWGEVVANEVTNTGDVGIRAVERGSGPIAVTGNSVSGAIGAGIAAFTVDVTIDDNIVVDSQVSFEDGLGEGIILASNVTASVTNNEIRGSGYNGIRFADGVSGTIEGNTISGSGLSDIHEDCGAFEPNDVTIGENALEGEISVCD